MFDETWKASNERKMKSIFICSFMMWLLAITFIDLRQTSFADKLPVQIGE